MKKSLKIILKLLAGVAAAVIITLALAYLALNYIYSDTFKFYHASNLSDYETMEEMFKEGYDPNMDTLWGRPLSAFVLSSRLVDDYHPFDINEAKFLLEHGVDPDYKTSTMSSPLLFAIIVGNTNYVELLIKYGVDLKRNILKFTPLDTAYIYERESIVSLLAERGVEIGDIAAKKLKIAFLIMYYYMRGVTDEKPVLQLISKKLYNKEDLLALYEGGQKGANKFNGTENKDYDRKKILENIKNLEH